MAADPASWLGAAGKQITVGIGGQFRLGGAAAAEKITEKQTI